MNEQEKLSKITILRGTIFDGAVVAPGDICDVDEKSEGDARRLIAAGKAIAGAVKRGKPAATDNRQVSTTDLDTK